jgi:hypothetical protein
MNRMKIEMKKLRAFVSDAKQTKGSDSRTMTFQANIMNLGFMFTDRALLTLSGMSDTELKEMYSAMIPELKAMKGDNVVHKPMYPNFPQQVMEASYMELFINAIIHYWSFGTLLPEYEKIERDFDFENIEYNMIDVATEQDFANVFTSILSTNDSISGTDKEIVEWFLMNYGNLVFPEVIPFKENMCIVGAYMVENEIPIDNLVKNATDVLRIAVHMSDGDVSLSSNTKFRNFKRRERRVLSNALANVGREEDIVRHSGKWIRLGHALHVGDYSQKAYQLLKKVRENEKIETFSGRVEQHLDKKHPVKAIKLLQSRPGDFARRLDHVLRMINGAKEQKIAVKAFLEVADSVSTRVLLQLKGHFARRDRDIDKRVVFPKGNIQKAELIAGQKALPVTVCNMIINGIEKILVDRFANGEKLGNIYIDPALVDFPIPAQQRSASDGTFDLPRGSRMTFGEDKNVLRFFLYWVGQDIDLSGIFYDENFKLVGNVAYTRLRQPINNSYAWHSGDITYAPHGASEFVDVDIEAAKRAGIRYVAMSVYVFSGNAFKDHDVSFAGWMTREHPQSNEIYDPKTVEYKIDLNSDNRNSVPVIFDLWERKAIWTDLSHLDSAYGYRPHNVHTNAASLKDIVEAMVSNDNKVNLYDLFTMHRGRVNIIDSREDADLVFAWDGDVTPKDVTTINSDYIV